MITNTKNNLRQQGKLLLSFVCMFYLNFGFAQKSYPETYDGDSIIRAGIQYYENNEYEKALAEFDKIFKTDPQYFLARYEKVLTLSNMELPDQVHDELEDWYHSENAFAMPEAMIVYGNSLNTRKKFEEAKKVFDQCKKIIPESPILMYNMALMYYNMEDKSKCIDYLKKTILLNPNHSTAHYFLGLVCFEEGKIVQGSLAMLGYLVIEPTGQYAEDAVQHLNMKMAQNFIKEDSKVIFPAGEDEFGEMEAILRDQLPLNPKYKLKCSVDDIFTRHTQSIFEYAASHDMKGGFFENTYLRWIKDAANMNLTESAIYYLMQQFTEKIGKPLKSKQNEIELFHENYILKDFWQAFGRRRQLHYGKIQDVDILFKDNHPYLIGAVINGKYEGKFRMIDKHYTPTGDLNFVNDMLEGKQVYYQKNGQISETSHFEKGIRNGIRTTYYENGKISVTETYKNDLYDGPFTTYYPNGNKNCEGSYLNNQLHGAYNCFHMDGSKRLESVFQNDKLHGMHKMYNPDGALISSFEYINGDIIGKGLEYHDGTTLISSANYKNGKVDGQLKVYWENGTLKNQTTYENGKIKSYEEFYANGEPSEIRSFNAKEELENILYFDINGDKNYEEKYASGNFKSGFQYLNSTTKPTEVKKNNFVVRYADGIISHYGKFLNDEMTGLWTYHHFNGNKSYEFDYKKNIAEGLRKSYDKAGRLTGQTTMKKNKASGLNHIFENGILTQVSYYNDDVQTGPYKVFRKDSTLKYEGYLVNNENQFNFYTYNNSGRLSTNSRYIENTLYWTKTYDKDGNVIIVDTFLNYHGPKIRKSENRLIQYQENYHYGVKSGLHTSTDTDGALISSLNYKNDQLHGKCVYYNPTGTLSYESDFYNGKVHGLSKYYDINGTLRTTSNYIFGVEYGDSYRYYQNGKLMFKHGTLADTKHGDYIFYNIEGDEVAALSYNLDYVEHYRVIDKATGKLGSPVKIAKDESISIESKYPDGKEAFSLEIDKSIWNKTLIIKDKNGNTNFSCEYLNGKINGVRIESYPDGRPYKVEQFSDGEYHGEQKFYEPDGNLMYTAEYKNDEAHGALKIYKKGKLLKSKIFDSDILTSIVNH